MNLYEATRDLHHACEAHPLGRKMVSGSVNAQEWADWLWSLRVLHQVTDPVLPEHMERDPFLAADLMALPRHNLIVSAVTSAATLAAEPSKLGAAYVLHGAHHSGGRVLAPKMAKRGLPTAHTCYKNPADAKAWLRDARVRVEFTKQARLTFASLLQIMDEISGV